MRFARTLRRTLVSTSIVALVALAVAMATSTPVLAQSIDTETQTLPIELSMVRETLHHVADQTPIDDDHRLLQQLDPVFFAIEGQQGEAGDGETGDGEAGAGGSGATAPGLAAGLMEALSGPYGFIALGGLGLASVVGAGLFLMARYIDPKEALGNPQRAMLFGFIKGNPGVHLKQLSDDFEMKTSTVLWHLRKLEAAELVRSQKVNGFRVFYPVAGGLEAKRLGAAIAAVSNENAIRILEFVASHPGSEQKIIADVLDVNPGTVRWHLRKLRERGILSELIEGRTSRYHATDLGVQALTQTRTPAAGYARPPAPVAVEA